MKSQYNTAAQQAIQHECAEEFDQAATFWRVAESFAVKPVNQQWAAMRTEFCEKRHSLAERLGQQQEIASDRAKEAAKTKAKKKMSEALEANIKTTSEETEQ